MSLIISLFSIFFSLQSLSFSLSLCLFVELVYWIRRIMWNVWISNNKMHGIWGFIYCSTHTQKKQIPIANTSIGLHQINDIMYAVGSWWFTNTFECGSHRKSITIRTSWNKPKRIQKITAIGKQLTHLLLIRIYVFGSGNSFNFEDVLFQWTFVQELFSLVSAFSLSCKFLKFEVRFIICWYFSI